MAVLMGGNKMQYVLLMSSTAEEHPTDDIALLVIRRQPMSERAASTN